MKHQASPQVGISGIYAGEDVNDVRWEVFGCGVGHKISS